MDPGVIITVGKDSVPLVSDDRDNIFPLRQFTFSSFFDINFLLGSIRVLIPVVVVFIFLVLGALAFLAIFLYRRFFLKRKELYTEVKTFFQGGNKKKKEEGQQPQQQLPSPHAEPPDGLSPAPSWIPSGQGTLRAGEGAEMESAVMHRHHSEFPPTTADVSDSEEDGEEVLRDMNEVLKEVMSKNKWCSAFENIIADNENNERNMRALHSILTIPMDYSLLSIDGSINTDMEQDNARFAVAIRRRQQLALTEVIPHFSSESCFRDDVLTARSGARAIANRLEELDVNGSQSGLEGTRRNSGSAHLANSFTHAHRDATSLNDSCSADSYIMTLMEDMGYLNENVRLAPGTLDHLVNAATHASIADPHYYMGSNKWGRK